MIDRLDKYFKKYLDNYVFLELMPHYIKREHLDFMRGVPMPVKKDPNFAPRRMSAVLKRTLRSTPATVSGMMSRSPRTMARSALKRA